MMPDETVEQMPGDLLRGDENVVQRIARLEYVAQKGQRMNIPQADDMLWLIRELRAALEDTERLDWLHQRGSIEIECTMSDEYAIGDQIDEEYHKTLREALDAARKKGEPNVG